MPLSLNSLFVIVSLALLTDGRVLRALTAFGRFNFATFTALFVAVCALFWIMWMLTWTVFWMMLRLMLRLLLRLVGRECSQYPYKKYNKNDSHV